MSAAELGAFCDGQLSGEDEARVAAALEHDPALRAEMASMMRDRARLVEAASAEERADPATAALAGRLAEALDRQRRKVMALRFGGTATAVAATAALGWFGHAALDGPNGTLDFPDPPAAMTAGVPAFVADAAGAHAVFAPDTFHPVEFTASDEGVMREWFAAHLGDAAMIPHLEELGFELIGGRMLGASEGAMAQLMYENDRGDRVSLVFGKRPVAGGKELKLVHLGKSYASYWSNRDFSWAVVEDSPGADVSAIATHVERLTRKIAQ